MSSLSLAIQAVKDKISLSAGTATPEELAYLGTALDRIGGRATVYEVVEMGDIKKAELADLATTLFASIETDTTQELATFVAAVDAKIAAMTTSANTLVDTSIQDITDTKNAAEAYIIDVKNKATTHASDTLTTTTTAIDSAKAAAITAVNNARDAANLSVTEASDALASAGAAAVQQSIDGSLYNLYYFSMV